MAKVIRRDQLEQMRKRGGEIARKLPPEPRIRRRNPEEERLLTLAQRRIAAKGYSYNLD